MHKVIVLGCGLVGGPMAADLSKDKDFQVTVVDLNNDVLDKLKKTTALNTIQADLSNQEVVSDLVKDYDIVLSAVPGFMGFQTLKTVIEAEKNVIDIAFFPEDLFELNDLAVAKDVTTISDIGVAPGMSNILIGYAANQLDRVKSAEIYVGGLPKKREWPFEYKAGFSPIDVLEEYTRPARYIENGKEVIKPALTDPELMDFDNIGTLEAFNSDGLRSLAKTIDAPYMIEKTLRYPGHIEIMRILRETGFFNKEMIEVNGTQISPIAFTSKLLFPKWKLEQGEEDITIMKIIVCGTKGSDEIKYTWDLFDTYDPVSEVHSMARTTGYTATMAVRMVASGLYTKKGVSAPEYVGKESACVDFILKGLKERGIVYNEKIEKI